MNFSIKSKGGFPEFGPVQSHRASDEIAQRIRLLVATKQLKTGDRLPPERELSGAFNVGRNTLREALRSLEIAGLIEMRKGGSGGAFITAGGSDAVVSSLLDLYHLGTITPTQLTEARLWIETIVVEVAAARLTEDDLAALEVNIEETQRAEDAGDFATRAAVGLEFHLLLGKATKNPILAIMMQALIELTRQYVATLGPEPNRFALPSKLSGCETSLA
ncbi:bacterial regulatory s, gntR family protein [Paraburkholderia xenovorans LB400]|uniref:Transcriptional regulator, GntR family n=1 Tax=Paraburkholderia xenovorans (strain LB400) TaxID=266265 RepID=Q13GW3_PARXL|nr:GntR family transcriptional regulator [Paraburkholderia xenovorans]ABE36676.1 transcriptional regulator, GntR family [Paraburkholderia xenovorans LB400]AIP34960.1 bacterial regulatory s, gntR family protein [Paraburkholderia xenovorans LB400]